MKRLVGLVLLVDSKENGVKVMLQRRGVQDSYPGACQVTVHGKLDDDEYFYQALIRESKEELGEKFTLKCVEDIELEEILHHKDDGKEVLTYGAVVPEERLDLIRLERTSGGVDMVPASQFFNGGVRELDPKNKRAEFPPSIRAMFKDEIEAVKLALGQILTNKIE